VAIHQNNYSKILSLRNTSATLDLQIRETLTLLTDTRRALLDTPSTVFPETTNPVSYSELLSYARRISKFTLPSTYREPEAPLADSDAAAGQGSSTPKESKSETQTNSTTTPVTATNGVGTDIQMGGTGIIDTVDSATPTNGAVQTSQETTASGTALPQHLTDHLNSSAEIQFIPWPTQEAIRKGALASIQVLLDQGIDPATFDPEKSAELEADRKRIAEEEDRVKEEQRARMEEEQKRREIERRMSVGGQAATQRGEQERPKVFQLDELDEDDSD
jgi:hypothetical protein